MNSAFGPPEDLPFDLRHLRHPARYDAPAGLADIERRKRREALGNRLEGYLRAMIEPVLAQRGAAARHDARRDWAREAIARLAASAARGDRPAIVSSLRLTVLLAPFAASAEPQLDHGHVAALRPGLVPAGFAHNRWEPHSNAVSWGCHGPSRRVDDLPNPECLWSTRMVLPGIFEMVVTVGERGGNHPIIMVDGRRLEARILDSASRLAGIARDLGLDGPMLLTAGLEGLDDVELFGTRSGRALKRPTLMLGELVVPDAAGLKPLILKEMFDRLWLEAGFDSVSPSFQNGEWQGDVAPHLYALD